MSLNLGSLLANSVRRHGDETALRDGDLRFSYRELDRRVRQFAADLNQSGIQRGDRVAIMSPNCPAFTIAYYGSLYCGAVVVTLNTLQTAEEVTFQLVDCKARVLVCHADCSKAGVTAFDDCGDCQTLYLIDGPDSATEKARRFEEVFERTEQADLAQTMPDDTAVIQYTSGTTGKPKGAELSHFNLFYNAQYNCERLFSVWPGEINILGPGEVGLAALPLYHTYGQTVVQNALLLGGGTVSYLRRFTPADALRVIARDRVTLFAGVPTMYFAILHDEAAMTADLSSLRFCVSGGAPLPVEVKQNFTRQFGVRIQEAYGLTETSPLATAQNPLETDKSGTIGKPIVGVEVRIADDQDREVTPGEKGEILIRGHNIMKGYHNRPEATADALRGGWFHSGDIGFIDPEGDIFIVDRKKDMILRGGYNVYPREVEEVLYTHPAVREAVVIGIPDERYGEEVKAFVSLKPGQTADEAQIREFCKEHVAAYKYPRLVEIRDDLPKGPTGKLLKRELRG